MEGEGQSTGSPEAFLNALGESLKGASGVDAGLVEILREHILKEAPAQNAVTQAKNAILKLAAVRADPLKPEAVNG